MNNNAKHTSLDYMVRNTCNIYIYVYMKPAPTSAQSLMAVVVHKAQGILEPENLPSASSIFWGQKYQFVMVSVFCSLRRKMWRPSGGEAVKGASLASPRGQTGRLSRANSSKGAHSNLSDDRHHWSSKPRGYLENEDIPKGSSNFLRNAYVSSQPILCPLSVIPCPPPTHNLHSGHTEFPYVQGLAEVTPAWVWLVR